MIFFYELLHYSTTVYFLIFLCFFFFFFSILLKLIILFNYFFRLINFVFYLFSSVNLRVECPICRVIFKKNWYQKKATRLLWGISKLNDLFYIKQYEIKEANVKKLCKKHENWFVVSIRD